MILFSHLLTVLTVWLSNICMWCVCVGVCVHALVGSICQVILTDVHYLVMQAVLLNLQCVDYIVLWATPKKAQ